MTKTTTLLFWVINVYSLWGAFAHEICTQLILRLGRVAFTFDVVSFNGPHLYYVCMWQLRARMMHNAKLKQKRPQKSELAAER